MPQEVDPCACMTLLRRLERSSSPIGAATPTAVQSSTLCGARIAAALFCLTICKVSGRMLLLDGDGPRQNRHKGQKQEAQDGYH